MQRAAVRILIIAGLALLGGHMMGFSGEAEKIKIFNAATGQVDEVEKIYKTDEEWKQLLTPEQFNVTRKRGTEAPYSGQCSLPKGGKRGLFKCVCCATDLFLVENEFESGTGWPSFWEPVSELNIKTQADNSLLMRRIEVLCARCDAHLGHVFDDGPTPTGKRYCINSVALKFSEIDNPKIEKLEKAAFSAGCFWGVEAEFMQVKGVAKTTVGYSGGKTKNPSYEEVSTGKTGHAESVELEYDPDIVSYDKLLEIFFDIHDPTTPNRQGPDIDSQYRSVIFYYTPAQKQAVLSAIQRLKASGKYKSAITTEVVPAGDFYKAEEYHQKYNRKHGITSSCRVR